MATTGVVLWAQSEAANLGVAALAMGTAALAEAAWPDMELTSQYFADGPAPFTIGSPRALAREVVLGDRGLKQWLRSYAVALDTRMGDSFTDIYGVRRLRKLVAMGEFVRHCQVPLVLTPQTVGPFTTREGRLLGSLSARRADLVLCRDSISAEVAHDLGCRQPILTTDVVFALEVPPAKGDFDVLLNVSGLLWQSNAHGPASSYREIVTSLVRRLREAGRQITLLAHVLDPAYQDNDVVVIRELAASWELPMVIPGSLREARQYIGGSQLLIGSRMHACLNALSVGVPAVALAYSRKFAPLLAQLKWEAVVGLGEPHAAEIAAGHALDPALAQRVADTRATADRALGDAVTALRGVQLRQA